MLLWTFMCKVLWGPFFCNFLGCIPRTLGYMIALCLNFWGRQEKKKNLCAYFKNWVFVFSLSFYFFKYLFTNLFIGWLGLCCCKRSFSSCSALASHCNGFSYWEAQTLGTWASLVAAYGLSSGGAWTPEQWLTSCGAWA